MLNHLTKTSLTNTGDSEATEGQRSTEFTLKAPKSPKPQQARGSLCRLLSHIPLTSILFVIHYPLKS